MLRRLAQRYVPRDLERALVRLCDLHGMERAEVARSLGITPGYVRVTLHRAHHKLAAEELRKQESSVRRRADARRARLGDA